jgi:hypothetical protein
MDKGVKFDSGKRRWSLLPSGVINEVIDVLEFGAQKYSVDNWKYVPDNEIRYYDAAMRHINAWHELEKIDPDSGKNHLAHAICCLMFLLWIDNAETQKES